MNTTQQTEMQPADVCEEFIAAQKSKGEILVYPRRHITSATEKREADDTESQSTHVNTTANAGSNEVASNGPNVDIIQRQTAVFSWQDVVYDIKIKGQNRRILDHVDGFVVPGTLTALMVRQLPCKAWGLNSAEDRRAFRALERQRCWTSSLLE